MPQVLYFDNNATTKLDDRVLDSMLPYFKEHFANQSALYSPAQYARGATEIARQQIAKAIHADASEIIFTSGGTEANNFAIRGFLESFHHNKPNVISSPIEHDSVRKLLKHLSTDQITLYLLSVDSQGIITIDHRLVESKKGHGVASIMLANNEIGSIQPIKILSEVFHEMGYLVHCDAVQALGKVSIDVKDLDVDFLSISAHKIHGPKGIGALYIKKGSSIKPLLHGGPQEMEMRAGTENVPAIIGFGKAASLAISEAELRYHHVLKLKTRLLNGLQSQFEDILITIDSANQLYNTVHCCFKHLQSPDLIMALDMENICVSSGSACQSGIPEASHVLKAIDTNKDYLDGALRISLSKDNTIEEVEILLEKLNKVVPKLIFRHQRLKT